MRRFLRDNKLRIIDFPDEYNEFRHLLLGRQGGTVGEMLNAERPCLDRSSLVYGDPATVNFTLSDNPKEVVVPLSPIKRIDDTSQLTEMYQTLLPNCEIVSVQRLCDSFSRARISSSIYRSSNNCGVVASWYNGECRPGRVRRFLTNDVVVKQGSCKRRRLTFVLAEVDWFKSHPEKHWYPDPLEVWCSDYESHSEMSFIPVLRILSQCLTVQYKVKFGYGREKVSVTIPLIGQFSL